MTRILFLSFFGFREYILDIKNEFTDQGYVVEQIPYLSLKQDNKMSDDQIILEIKKVVFSDPLNPIKFIMMFILPSNANFIKNLKTVCSISDDGVKHNLSTVFYNFDDPVSINVDLLNYSRNIDLFITPLEESMDKLKILLSPMTQIHHSPVFITNIPKYTEIPEAQKTTDIVVFYDTSHEYVYDIKKMLIEIKHMCIDHDMRIKLYGSSDLEDVYPDIYIGVYNKDNLQQIASEGKVCIFMENNFNKNSPIDPMVYNLMKYGCILMIPYNKKISRLAKDQLTCLIYDDKYLEKLFNCVKKYNKFKLIGKQAHDDIESKYSLKAWTKHMKLLIDK
jgi:hypothetical protein